MMLIDVYVSILIGALTGRYYKMNDLKGWMMFFSLVMIYFILRVR